MSRHQGRREVIRRIQNTLASHKSGPLSRSGTGLRTALRSSLPLASFLSSRRVNAGGHPERISVNGCRFCRKPEAEYVLDT